MSKPLRPLLLLLLGLVLGIVGYYYFCVRETTPPTVAPEVLRVQALQRLRLITKEITYRQDVDLYMEGQHAIGTADLVAYVKYDLETLQITPQGRDTFFLVLPDPEIELGRRPGGAHDIRYYLDQGGRAGAPSADRVMIRRLNQRLREEAEQEIRTNPRYLPEAKKQAERQLLMLLQSLAPSAHFIFTETLTLPSPETSRIHDKR